ncbi:MAG: SRPBCC family protein [Prevotellaceae bacterium]|nr:SRPBCC family protein [Prevotellaceae bacterium]
MTKYESSIKLIPASQQQVYATLSDLNNLERLKQALPQEKVKNLRFDADSLTIEAAPMGEVTMNIVEKEPCKCIKFAATSSPLPFNLWIQIIPENDAACKLRLTVGLDINPFLKAMVQKPLSEGIEKMAELLALIPYHQIALPDE